MKTDYKFRTRVRGNGRTEATAIVYEGDYENVTKTNMQTDEVETKLVYVRSKALREINLNLEGDVNDEDLTKELNKELGKDPIRTPINEQKI